jgi:hypothetical protein
MNAAVIWAGGIACALVVLTSIYLIMLFRALRNEQVIGNAIRAMHAALDDDPSPQRSLLSSVADALMAQERAAARIEVTVHELALRGSQVPPPEDLLKELLALPEPQQFITDFLSEYGSYPASRSAFSSVAADLLRAATIEVFGDLAGENPVGMERLLLLADEGTIATVAMAGIEADGDSLSPPYRAPGVADLDAVAMAGIVRALDRTIRRQLRLATLLHGQAEAILGTRGDGRRRSVLRAHAQQLLRLPWPGEPEFGSTELTALAAAFDAVGEVIDTAAERLNDDEPMSAAHLLAGLRVPVPGGLPGRIYHQESLAQARPLAALGTRHRLEVCRWAGAALRAVVRGEMKAPPASPLPSGRPPDHSTDDQGTVTV